MDRRLAAPWTPPTSCRNAHRRRPGAIITWLAGRCPLSCCDSWPGPAGRAAPQARPRPQRSGHARKKRAVRFARRIGRRLAARLLDTGQPERTAAAVRASRPSAGSLNAVDRDASPRHPHLEGLSTKEIAAIWHQRIAARLATSAPSTASTTAPRELVRITIDPTSKFETQRRNRTNSKYEDPNQMFNLVFDFHFRDLDFDIRICSDWNLHPVPLSACVTHDPAAPRQGPPRRKNSPFGTLSVLKCVPTRACERGSGDLRKY